MNSNWFKLLMKANRVKYGKRLNLHGIPVIKKESAVLSIGENVTIR